MAQPEYITVDEWVIHADVRVLEELGSDTGGVGIPDDTNEILKGCIKRASADIESKALRGGRYSDQDLLDFQADDDWTLKGLCVDLATGYLYERRVGDMPPDADAKYNRGLKLLDELRDGGRIFRDEGSVTAGQPSIKLVRPDTRELWNQPSDTPFFPTRNPETG